LSAPGLPFGGTFCVPAYMFFRALFSPSCELDVTYYPHFTDRQITLNSREQVNSVAGTGTGCWMGNSCPFHSTTWDLQFVLYAHNAAQTASVQHHSPQRAWWTGFSLGHSLADAWRMFGDSCRVTKGKSPTVTLAVTAETHTHPPQACFQGCGCRGGYEKLKDTKGQPFAWQGSSPWASCQYSPYLNPEA
jgi:hypothetical protein